MNPISKGNVAGTCVMWQLAVLAGDFLLARASVANATLRNFEVGAPCFSRDEPREKSWFCLHTLH